MSANKTYDIVIVGAGLGGLLSAVMLAKEGMHVCVIEKDKQIGGCLQTFSLNKKVFDSCVHYIGGLGEGHTLSTIFKYAGIYNKLNLQEYDHNAFDKVAFGNDATLYPLAQGKENFVDQLSEYFPEERESLQKYIQEIVNVGDHFPLYRLRKGDANEKSAVNSKEVTSTIENITSNKKLQQVLTGNNLLYAGKKDITPFYLHALVTESYMHSSHKVLPGSSQIAKFLWQELQQYGGEIIRNTEVTQLIEKDGIIVSAKTNNGEEIHGKQFIANLHPEVLLSILDSKMIRPVYRKRISNLEQTTSTYMLNAVLKPCSVPMQHSNLYWNATHDSWAAVKYEPESWPANYAVFYTEDKDNKGFAESVSILSYMYYKEVAPWSESYNRTGQASDRGPSYEEFKASKNEVLLSKVYERIPELKGNIIATKAATPLTYRDYTGTPQGSLYGILKDVNKTSETTIPTHTKIPNLLLTGQNVNLHGVLGVSITAVATCAELIGMDHLLDKINKQR